MVTTQQNTSIKDNLENSPKRAPSLYLKAARCENVGHPPIWLMRQAGRYLPEYLQVRSRYSFLDVCNIPEVATEVTLQPIRRFGFDASILFSDILIPLVPMGARLSFDEGVGPRISNRLRTREDVAQLRVIEPRQDLANVLEAVRMIRAELPPSTALIGFAGAPFTLASYWVEGGRPDPFVNLKTMMYRAPDVFREMMSRLAETVANTLIAMVEAGADAVQVFDTWGGILPRHEFRAYNLPFLKTIFTKLQFLDVPMTYFVKDGGHLTADLPETMATVFGLDWRTSLAGAGKVLGDRFALQGNLDPTALFGDEASVRRETRRVLDDAGDRAGHIFNLGHGILPTTPIESVEFMIDEVRNVRK